MAISGYSSYITGLMNLASSVSSWMGPSFCDAYCYDPEDFEEEFAEDIGLKREDIRLQEWDGSEKDILRELFGSEEEKMIASLQYWISMKIGREVQTCLLENENELTDKLDGNRNNTRFFFLERIFIIRHEKAILVLISGNNE